MDADFITSLGLVTSISVSHKTAAPDLIDLHFHTASQKRKGYTMTLGAARTMWYHLTEILYPNAARQLTPRTATPVIRPATPLAAVFAVEVKPHPMIQRIEIIAVSAIHGWNIEISVEEGYELWAYLSERCMPLATHGDA